MKQQQFKKTVLASLLTLTSGVALSAPYEIVDLGGLNGSYSVAYKINDQGIAVGTANGPLIDDNGDREFYSHAAKFQDGGNEDLGVLPDGDSSEALGINSAGVAVGFANVLTEIEQEDGTKLIAESNFAVIFDGSVNKLAEKENLSGARL